jgi:arginase
MQKDITFLINPSEIAAGTRGASLGPAALMTAARKAGSFLFGEHPVKTIADVNHLLDHPVQHRFAKRIEGLTQVFAQIGDAVKETLEADGFPLVLAGDHGSAGGTIAGIRAAFPHKRLGVVWIDAHGDLHSPYTTPSGNMHGMPLSTALNEDNKPCQVNEIPAQTEVLWNELKNQYGIAPKIRPEDLVFIGVRDTEAQEDALIERLGIRNFGVEELNRQGTAEIVRQALDLLGACDCIYISFDVDSMDPEMSSHGTGTPVPKGLSPEQAQELMLGLLASEKTVALEFVEINPCLDEKTNRMAEIAFGILDTLVAKITQQ